MKSNPLQPSNPVTRYQKRLFAGGAPTYDVGNANTLSNGKNIDHVVPNSVIISDAASPNAPKHPEYKKNIEKWCKYRLTSEGGDDFIDKYLERFSKRETELDFQFRRRISYCAAHAKAGLTEIKNAIFKNFCDIERIGGPESYKTASETTLNSFIGCEVLYELLALGKVGIYIDREAIEDGASIQDAKTKPIYLYAYKAEAILNWAYGSDGQLLSVLLKDSNYATDANDLIVDEQTTYRLLKKTPQGVEVAFFDPDYEPIGEPKLLRLMDIPFVIVSLGHSLLQDVANYQIALTNMSSSDVSFSILANFPFYTEQVDPLSENAFAKKSTQRVTGTGATELRTINQTTNEINVGVTKGRKFSKGLERPGFIHPSSEPLIASMEKQGDMQQEVRVLMDLALTNLAANRTSAASKQEDKTTKEEGLSYIGLVLEHGERLIAKIWAAYEGSTEEVTVNYPTEYSLMSDTDRIAQADTLQKLIPMLPSITYKRTLAKRIAYLIVGQRVSEADLKTIYQEIDEAAIISVDPEEIIADLEAGLVSTAYASTKLKGYPKEEVEQAKKDHTERLAEIAKAQSSATNKPPEGVPDIKPTPKVKP